MKDEPRTEGPNINMMLRSDLATKEDKGKNLEKDMWVCKAPRKATRIWFGAGKGNFLEAKKNFAKALTSSSEEQPDLKQDNALVTTFLETYMKLLWDANMVNGL